MTEPTYIGPSDVVRRLAEIKGRRIEIDVPRGFGTRKVRGLLENAWFVNGGTAQKVKLAHRVKPILLIGGANVLPDRKPTNGEPK